MLRIRKKKKKAKMKKRYNLIQVRLERKWNPSQVRLRREWKPRQVKTKMNWKLSQSKTKMKRVLRNFRLPARKDKKERLRGHPVRMRRILWTEKLYLYSQSHQFSPASFSLPAFSEYAAAKPRTETMRRKARPVAAGNQSYLFACAPYEISLKRKRPSGTLWREQSSLAIPALERLPCSKRTRTPIRRLSLQPWPVEHAWLSSTETRSWTRAESWGMQRAR